MSATTVWKYTLRFNGATPQRVPIPVGWAFAHFAVQDDHPTLWAVVDPELNEHRFETFVVAGTGAVLDEDRFQHLGSCLDGGFVWHLWADGASHAR